MTRINTNVSSLTAQRGLRNTQAEQAETLQRLSTGLRINRGADDPAGLIASEGLRSEIAGIEQAIDNSQRASNVIATAEGALGEVASLLLNVKALIVEAANTGAISPGEIEANQLQVDSAVESITRISNTTTFNGLKLLDGGLDYTLSGVPSAVTALRVSQSNFGTNASIPVQVEVLQSAGRAALQFRGSAVASTVTLEITGNEGVDTLSFTSGTPASAVMFAINRTSDLTGVTAVPINSANLASGIEFRSDGYGSRSFVSIQAQDGAFGTTDAAGTPTQRTKGTNATATINGALTVGDGLEIELNSTTLDVAMTLDPAFGVGNLDFDVVGGGGAVPARAEGGEQPAGQPRRPVRRRRQARRPRDRLPVRHRHRRRRVLW